MRKKTRTCDARRYLLIGARQMLDGTYFFECRCGSDYHTLRFVYDKEDHEFYVSIFLNSYRRWYQRWWVALKYALGYKCKYGHWDNWTMDERDIDKMKGMINRFEKDNK
jgi:hypothetical protein